MKRFVGTAPSSDRDFETTLPYFSQITPENASKWGSVEAERDVMDFSGADLAYEFARENGLAFKFHALVWGQQEPPWMAQLPPLEQLEELEEWMSLVAERYPDLELIDVVNEPLHEPPSYAEALGGSGESGWDWVVGAFEMARAHFPNSTLIVNDYDILKHESFTQNYVEPISVLQERGLVDAIGLQAHNLERSEPAVVAANLATLADTGLPLYISEFDLDIRDDALHARRFRDLFSTFWESSAVHGITLWGHLQGDTWRANTYLIRQDQSERPAMEWLQCFLDARVSCDILEYEPPPRRGSINGLTLEAENFDETAGVIVLGTQIGYADEGDWISYLAVQFRPEWDEITVVYSNGLETTGTVSFHLDDPESAPVAAISLPPTGGWGNRRAISGDFPEVHGEKNLYIRFNDVDGVGNFDKFRLGMPAPQPDDSNLIPGGDFEFDTTGWSAWAATVELELDNVHEGFQSLRLTDRAQHGSANYDLRSSVTSGQSYQLSLFADISGNDAEQVVVSIRETCSGEATTLVRLVDPVLVVPGEWTSIEAPFSVSDCALSEFQLLVAGPPAGIDIFLDDVRVE